jgi:hypothetical protein
MPSLGQLGSFAVTSFWQHGHLKCAILVCVQYAPIGIIRSSPNDCLRQT